MTTVTTFRKGKCGLDCIRLKLWDHGFSIKCLKAKKTIVGRPRIEDYLKYDLITFCENCSVLLLNAEKKNRS